jgi:uncharacterized protein (DUF849 family)
MNGEDETGCRVMIPRGEVDGSPTVDFTTCGVGRDKFAAIMQSCLMGGHMRVGLSQRPRTHFSPA